MFIDTTTEQKDLQAELRDYFAKLMANRPTGNGESMAGSREIVRQMGRDGWLGVGWPTEYGGRGLGPVEQLIFLEEAARVEAPIPMVTLNTVGPTIAQYGTPAQKDKFLPAILSGELNVAIGYSEPDAGTDLASLRTRAVRDGAEYVVNGQKVFTTQAHEADYVWLACRTDPEAPKHRGISILMVDTTLPGFKTTPIWVVGGGHTNASYYEDVRVPTDMLVGDENGGWRMITNQLNFERVALGPAAGLFRDLDSVLEWARTTVRDGQPVIDREWVRLHLARVRAKAEIAQLFNWRVAWAQQSGEVRPADASAMKVYGTELTIEALRLLMEVVGTSALYQAGSPGEVLHGSLERKYRAAIVTTFGGGVNEVQREIIARTGLGTPRVPR